MALSPVQIRFALLQFVLLAAVATGLWLAFPGWRLGLVTERIHKDYPDVQQISTKDLAVWLARPNTVKPVLLDVRTKEEFAASHLVEAHRVDGEAELRNEDLPDDKQRAIVVYCSTGERSAAFGRRLQRAGYSSVMLLEGAIVRWANERRPMTDGRGLVTRVHPPDPETARLLKNAYRVAP